MTTEYKVKVHGEIQIWTEFHIVKENEIHLRNFKDFASDCVLIFDRETKCVLESSAYLSEAKLLTKGEFEGLCNRTACQKPGAIYYNHSTKKYYCPTCADMLNKYNKADAMRLYGHDLCTKVKKEVTNDR